MFMNSTPIILTVSEQISTFDNLEYNFFFLLLFQLGMTPLMLCAKHNKVPEARILLDYFADPNIQDPKSGRSVLFFAIEYNNCKYELIFPRAVSWIFCHYHTDDKL